MSLNLDLYVTEPGSLSLNLDLYVTGPGPLCH